ncbi:hypothetical protein SeMB42_g00461 [Synchytrium endobioticum]|uniref:Uncharacterized protein n=1 Tax=Synchytrium endobioticum TaxID=286115 RepID=A0A507DIX2_9FUNG|nr:hypothetical protein SeLEV6574_g00324 [Synchytrium endobioticum]TPX54065.1 hypothetical protein SeMB42_g00461 [Synchytrium endobioticum]
MPVDKMKNPLLVPIQVGKSKCSVRTLPPDDYAYGLVIERDPNETTACSLQWKYTTASHRDAREAPLDYIAMNRNAAKKGLWTPKAVGAYRADNQIRVKLTDPTTASAQRRPKLPSDKNPSHTYGKLVRPSTPVAKLMNKAYYENQFLEETRRKEDAEVQARKEKLRKKNAHSVIPPRSKKPHVAKLGDTMADDPAKLYKMPRFRNVGPKISSHRAVGVVNAQITDAVCTTADAPIAQ